MIKNSEYRLLFMSLQRIVREINKKKLSDIGNTLDNKTLATTKKLKNKQN